MDMMDNECAIESFGKDHMPLVPQMLSEKWRERAGQRTSLAQSNAELHGRLERSNDRNQQQQQTIEHLQVQWPC